MNHPLLSLIAAGLAMSTALASAQPGSRARDCAASGPTADCPMHGDVRQHGMNATWGQEYTPGWSMMSPAERQEHLGKLRSFKTYDECHDYVSKHHEQMAARAKEKGQTLPEQPRRDACAGLKSE